MRAVMSSASAVVAKLPAQHGPRAQMRPEAYLRAPRQPDRLGAGNAHQPRRRLSFVTPGDSTTGEEFALRFGSDAERNAVIQFGQTAETYHLGAGSYHLFSMVYLVRRRR